MKDILLEILDWLCVLNKNCDILRAAWELIHPLLKQHLNAEWLQIVDSAINGLSERAMSSLHAAKEKIKRVCNSNREFMKKIRELDEKYYPDIVKTTATFALTGAGAGGYGGGIIVGPPGAAVGAIVGATVGAVGGFLLGGWHAVSKQQRDQ